MANRSFPRALSAAVRRWSLYPGSGFVDQVLRSDRNWVYDVGGAHGVIITITGWQVLDAPSMTTAAHWIQPSPEGGPLILGDP
ncbi:hypothetical protein [Nocardia asiatica]|uniref:hypothetical protein n=1 Tax=Nocardia asiatica TaxID=209252 RepID=UPI003EE2EB6B